MADIELPSDLLPLHVEALRAERAMTEARLAGGDVEAAREAYLAAVTALHALPYWEETRQAKQHYTAWQDSLKAAKAALDGEV